MPSIDDEIGQLQTSVAAIEGQRAILGDAVVDAALSPMREKLAALLNQTPSTQQRKQVTILFADVSGFTALSETLDAEFVAEIMNALWALVDRVITDHGGRIDKHIGDAVMAVWGVDAAREDDPQLAVRAALGMQTAIHAFCAAGSGAPDGGPMQLAMRIGVNTGPVLLGTVGTTNEFTAMGDAVNLASRLEHAAPVGGVLISEDTYRHIRGIFDVAAQAPLTVKGKVEPVQTFIVERVKPRAFRMVTRGVEGIETKMIGRDAELQILQSAFEDAIEETEPRVVTVIGEAGVGKSRLLYEFDKFLELRAERILYFKGRSTPNLQNVPYSLFRDLFAFRFQILDSDSTAVALDKFRQGMAGVVEPRQAEVIGHWLGFDFSSSEAVKPLLGSRDFEATARTNLIRYFRKLAAAGPVVILFEDMHWSDDQSLDLAAYLTASVREAPLIIIAVSRPSLFERRPGWGEGETAFKRISLTPLSKRASRVLVDEILQRVDRVPDALVNLIIDSAEGNPFYVEEVIKTLIDQGVIVRSNTLEAELSEKIAGSDAAEHWTIRIDKLANLSVPPTLTGLLQARLDGLPRSEREVLQRAAVIGRLFWDEAVADLAESSVDELRPLLAAARGRELIFRREHSSFIGADEFVFKHALLRDVAYETVLLKHRAEFHSRIARWLEAHAGERLAEYLSLIAEHYLQAGEYEYAGQFLYRAGSHAKQFGSLTVARLALERAIYSFETAKTGDSELAIEARLKLGTIYAIAGDLPNAEAVAERALDDARRSRNEQQIVDALLGLGFVANIRGEYERARNLTKSGLSMAEREGDQLVLSRLFQSLSASESFIGDLALAKDYATKALIAARAVNAVDEELAAINMLGINAAYQSDWGQAEQLYTDGLNLSRRVGFIQNEMEFLINLGSLAYRRGDYEKAKHYAQDALVTNRDRGNRQMILVLQGNLAQAELKLGQTAAARDSALEALTLSVEMGAVPFTLFAVQIIGEIAASESNMEEALTLFGLARAHPAAAQSDIEEIEQIVSQLNLPADTIATGMAVGAALELDTVVVEILDGKW